MDLVGEFHKLEIDGKLNLVYHNVQYPLPQLDIPKSAIGSGQDLPLQPHFICPRVRQYFAFRFRGIDFEEKMIKFTTSPLSDGTRYNHPVLPLFWCNNKEAEVYDDCDACHHAKVGTCYYFCDKCGKRISRHHHRVSFVSSLPSAKRSCGVCRREVVSHYGAYVCTATTCSGYAVHTNCALRKDIWDGKELEGVPEEDDVYDDVEPFVRIADGMILHFSHGHNLRVETSRVYDEKKFCQACILPIYDGEFYVCVEVECNFILHETCANAPRKKLHPLHPHPLQLEVYDGDAFSCTLCGLFSNGFVYWCYNEDCDSYFRIDIRCALVSEPFTNQGHQHPLFLALDPKEKPMCHVCKSTDDDEKLRVLNCIECDFVICFGCATLPYTARYKHDDHCLTFCHGDEASDSDWCELCESKLADYGGRRGFYKCDDCCTTLHILCLLGPGQYLKSGGTIKLGRDVMLIHANTYPSRPICFYCHRHCPDPIFFVFRTRVSCGCYF
ncbi:unnamed protein product [Microthlaspi erraticum]|uniref:Phorbol-ester/DAG-type domain-containing protein n=1 Tax=Microthlaspi erraticum TaxID=1685480 RepID=A0A6D2JVE5_9BRAS|nr:unnamed protein product [Microthlaspi erraticum]